MPSLVDGLLHDLKTKITVIKSLAYLDETTNEQMLAAVDDLVSLTQRAALVSDIANRRVLVVGKKFDITKNNAFKFHADDVLIVGDEKTLDLSKEAGELLLSELLSNAVRFGSGRVMISIHKSDSGKTLRVENAITQALDTAKLSEIFYSTEGRSGLGLTVAGLICEQSNGSLAITSDDESFSAMAHIGKFS